MENTNNGRVVKGTNYQKKKKDRSEVFKVVELPAYEWERASCSRAWGGQELELTQQPTVGL